jgi:hypothetical protein
VTGGETCAAAGAASLWPSLVTYLVLFLIVPVLILCCISVRWFFAWDAVDLLGSPLVRFSPRIA